jgi:hypothetical protein
LLTVSGNILDAAFLNMVHMYKAALGDRFPKGVFDWPPTEWLQSYDDRKKRVRAEKKLCDEPDRKRQRPMTAIGVEAKARVEAAGRPSKSAEKTRVQSAGCQPLPASKIPAKALALQGKSAASSPLEAAGPKPKSASKTKGASNGCQPKTAMETVPKALVRQQKSAASTSRWDDAVGRGDRDRRSSTASSSTGPRNAPPGMLKISDKWGADVGVKL